MLEWEMEATPLTRATRRPPTRPAQDQLPTALGMARQQLRLALQRTCILGDRPGRCPPVLAVARDRTLRHVVDHLPEVTRAALRPPHPSVARPVTILPVTDTAACTENRNQFCACVCCACPLRVRARPRVTKLLGHLVA